MGQPRKLAAWRESDAYMKTLPLLDKAGAFPCAPTRFEGVNLTRVLLGKLMHAASSVRLAGV